MMNQRWLGVMTVVVAIACGEGQDGENAMSSDDAQSMNDTGDPSNTDGNNDIAPTAGYSADAIQAVLALPETPLNYENPSLPSLFDSAAVRALHNAPADNPITDEGATLGRVLFYDTLLSANRTLSCSSCHASGAGFSDPDQFSTGFEGGFTGRNSMSLMNLAYYANGAMFWDERADSLEEQVLMPIQDTVEMGLTLEQLVQRVEDTDYYPLLFELAFGDSAVTSERISFALAQYVRSIVSSGTRYDEGLAAAGGNTNMDFANFSAEENRGKELFFAPAGAGGANCAVCHADADGAPGPRATAVILQMGRARNNGLAANTSDDGGLGDVTGRPQDDGLFKSSSLRNIALTGPYMHDGSLETLRDVVEHYNSGIEDHPNLDRVLRGRGNQPQRLDLSDDDIDAVVAFMETLTDESVVNDERFTNPFR
ncbi:MAG: cytochrome c peroxidase [Myxococcota bacterium]